MIEDILKSIRATLYDRTSSPLFGSALISWILWNFRFVIVIFSDLSIREKFEYIDTVLYADPIWRWLPLALGPALTTLFILFVYPWPAQWVYQFWQQRQRELKEIRQKIEDETPLTTQESRAIRRQVIEIQSEYEVQLNRRSEEISRLKQLLAEEQSAKTELSQLLAQKEMQLEEKDSLLSDIRNQKSLRGLFNEKVPSAEEISMVLRRTPYRLVFNPRRDRASGSKPMLFGPDGKIVEGGNKNENSWRVKDGLLELMNAAGEVHNRFKLDISTGVFTTTGDSDVSALPGQYMVPESTSTNS